MTRTAAEISALVGSRICHDLISPIGAIGNGLELLQLGGAGGPEFELMGDSVENASSRIRLFRIAFGAVSDQPIDASAVRGVLEDLRAGGKTTYDWPLADPLPRRDARKVMLAILCLHTEMPYGGEIAVTRGDDGWIVTGRADKLVDSPCWGIVDNPDRSEIAPAHVQFLLLTLAAQDDGNALGVERTKDTVTLRF